MKVINKKQIHKKRIFFTLAYFIPVAFLTTLSMGLFVAGEYRNFDLVHDKFEKNINRNTDQNQELMTIFEGQQWEGLSMSNIDKILIQNNRKPMFADLRESPIYDISTTQISNRLLNRINFTGQRVLEEEDFLEAREEIFNDTVKYILFLWVFLLSFFAFFAYWISGKVIKPLIDALEKQSQFISDAAHELKTPLSLIKTDADVLGKIKQKDVESYESFRTRTLKSVGYLNNLTSKLLKLSKLEDGKEEVLEKINVSEIVFDTFEYFENKALEKKINLQKDIEENIYSKISDQELSQVVTILLDNAIKYTPESGKVFLSLKKGKKHFYLKVSDSGAGIEKEERKKIFERFYRVDKSRSESSHGLGLSIAKQIVSKNSGKIEAKKSDFNGALFEVEFPVVKK